MEKRIWRYIVLIGFVFIAASCGNKKSTVSLAKYADTANYYAEKIAEYEAKQDMSDIDLFLKMSDSAALQKKAADEVLSQMFVKVEDTLFLPFEQTKNDERIQILSVWAVGMRFDEVLLEARVKAIDNSSFMGPHAGLVVQDKNKNLFEVGGGIQGPTDEKLDAGKTYIFTGKIEHLHLLTNFKSIVFNEDIKKW